jgi:dihydroorotate dehydrogenase (NAD+) catalytic subunit
MAIDVERFRPRLATGYGVLSGPAIRPVAVRAVHEVSGAFPDVPIMGVGGVVTASDALEFLIAGAWAVQVGSAVFSDPAAPVEVARGIVRFLRERGLLSVDDLRTAVLAARGESERDGS